MKQIALFILAMLFALPAHAEDALVRTITVTGEAKESLSPDRAIISVQAYAKNMALEKAKSEHDANLKALLKLARDFGISDKNVSTDYMRINPQYRWVDNTQTFEGYEVLTSISYKIDDLSKVGRFVQAAVEAKAYGLNGPNYTLRDDKPVRDRVRIEALKDAHSKAEALAGVAGMKVGKPISISDSYHQATPVIQTMKMERAMMASAAPAMDMGVTPPAGEMEVNAQAFVTYELTE